MDFVKAIQTGNVVLFDKALEHQERNLVKMGTYLTVEGVRMVVVRKFIQKM